MVGVRSPQARRSCTDSVVEPSRARCGRNAEWGRQESRGRGRGRDTGVFAEFDASRRRGRSSRLGYPFGSGSRARASGGRGSGGRRVRAGFVAVSILRVSSSSLRLEYMHLPRWQVAVPHREQVGGTTLVIQDEEDGCRQVPGVVAQLEFWTGDSSESRGGGLRREPRGTRHGLAATRLFDSSGRMRC